MERYRSRGEFLRDLALRQQEEQEIEELMELVGEDLENAVRDTENMGEADSGNSVPINNDYDNPAALSGTDAEFLVADEPPALAEEGEHSISQGALENESSQGETKRQRKRKGRKEQWKDNLNKNLREQGLAYNGWSRSKKQKAVRGAAREGRKMGDRCDCNGKNKKCYAVLETLRTFLFSTFWTKMSWDQKRIYLVNLVETNPTARRTTSGPDSRRSATMSYFIKSRSGFKFRVCKKMFLATFGIKETFLYKCLNGSHPMGGMIQSSARASSSRTRIPPASTRSRTILVEFIDSLPKLPSHYCRRDSSKLYVEPLFGNNVASLYREYVKKCETDQVKPLSRFSFDQLVAEKNLSFQQPKKDRCDLCCQYDVGNGVEEAEYSEHVRRKNQAREEKERDKQQAKEGNLNVFTQDVQAVKVCPQLNASALYYKTKLCCHNFTIYNLQTSSVMCYWFTEADADLSASTFASCIVSYLEEKVTTNNNDIVLWSDGCCNQNRNNTLSNALLAYACEKSVTVYQKYLEKGHTQMEVDSVHAVIERAVGSKPIYLPSDYVRLTEQARVKDPYESKTLTYDFTRDFSSRMVSYFDARNSKKIFKKFPDRSLSQKQLFFN